MNIVSGIYLSNDMCHRKSVVGELESNPRALSQRLLGEAIELVQGTFQNR